LVKVWRFVLLDDHSRMRFFRFVAVDKPNSSHVVAFLMEAYEEMGVPKVLYTDNDKVIKYARNLRAAHVLNKALESSGGYKLDQHKAGNSRATGKVENAHQWVEKNEKLLGKFMAEGRVLTMEVLNRFAAQLCLEYNHRVHRETGQKPIDRWNAQRHMVRKVDSKILKSALLVDEFDVVLNGDLTFKHKGVVYQLPTDQSFQNLIPRQSKTNKVKIVFPENVDFYTLIDFDKNEFEIEKRIASPDSMGEFKSTAEDVSEKTRKELKKFAKEISTQEKDLNKQGFEPKPILFIDTEFDVPKSNVANFPKPTVDVTPQILDQLPTTHQRSGSANSYDGQLISWYDAVRKFAEFFTTTAECKEVLDTVYASRDEYQPETLVRQTIEDYLISLPKIRVAK
ncbi:MAG TPA: hypothetical protein PKY59_12235, partial [Pyrinomonadaceae bacterium]|nr:hypothetical protein [Pyrinomonadaceae bacterium]